MALRAGRIGLAGDRERARAGRRDRLLHGRPVVLSGRRDELGPARSGRRAQAGRDAPLQPRPGDGRQPDELVDDVEMPGALPDVLSCDGKNIFLRDKILDERRGTRAQRAAPVQFRRTARRPLVASDLLDLRSTIYGRASGWAVVANYVPSGRLLVLDETTVFGYGRKSVSGGDRGLADVPLHLFRADQQVTPLAKPTRLKNNNLALAEHFVPTKVNYHWSQEIPVVARAMVLAGDTLFVAGPEMAVGADAEEPNFDEGEALLMAFSIEDGSELYRRRLDAQPVFDGMIAAGGRLYLSLNGGSVLCLGSER